MNIKEAGTSWKAEGSIGTAAGGLGPGGRSPHVPASSRSASTPEDDSVALLPRGSHVDSDAALPLEGRLVEQNTLREDAFTPKFGFEHSRSSIADVDPAQITQKLNKHLLWKYALITVLCYLDRVNISYAAKQLMEVVGFTEGQYGLGSGLFFVGYVAFQVPSNLILMRVGARRWLALLLLTWGALASSFAFVSSPASFFLMRILLGVAESGAMPGMWYHMSLFYSEREITVAWAWVMVAIAISQVVGGPLAAALLALDGRAGLHGYQWLFLLEGAPTVLLGLFLAATLADQPLTASFLEPRERAVLAAQQARLRALASAAGADTHAWEAVRNLRIWHLTLINLLANIPKFGYLFWLPLIIDGLLSGKGSGAPASPSVTAAVTALPYSVTALAIILNSQHSKRTGERRWHVAAPLMVAGGGLGLAAFLIPRSPAAAFAALFVAAVLWAPDAVLASWPATFLQGPAAATGVALINSISSIGSLLGPVLLGYLGDWGLLVLSGGAWLVAGLALAFPNHGLKRRDSGMIAVVSSAADADAESLSRCGSARPEDTEGQSQGYLTALDRSSLEGPGTHGTASAV